MPQISPDAAVAGLRAELPARDAANRDRANHTGAQSPSTIEGFATAAAAAAPVQSVAGRSGAVTLAKADVGLANVDNTADTAKPVSGPQQIALNAKADLSAIATVGLTGNYNDLSGKPDLSLAGLGAATAAQGAKADTAVQPAQIAGLAPLTVTQGTIAYAASVNLDMAALTGTHRTIALTGNLTLASSNRGTGRAVVLRLIADATQRILTFPSDWVFIGARPASIAASKTGILSLTFFGPNSSDCVAAWGFQE